MTSEPQDTKNKIYIPKITNQTGFILIFLETAEFVPQFTESLDGLSWKGL